MNANTKITIVKGTKVTRVNDVAADVPTFIQTTTTSDDNTHTVNVEGRALYLDNEGKTWVRGWTGNVVAAFKRRILAEDRKCKLLKAKAERKRDEERMASTIKWLRGAAAIVKRAKLPKELRQTAFKAALSPYLMMR